MNAIKSGLATGIQAGQGVETIRAIEESVKRMVGLNQKISNTRLRDDLLEKYPDNSRGIEMAIMNMVKKDELQQTDGSNYITRKK